MQRTYIIYHNMSFSCALRTFLAFARKWPSALVIVFAMQGGVCKFESRRRETYENNLICEASLCLVPI
jgi:hypothetical protein